MGCRRGYARGLLDSLASLHSISSWWRIISIDYAWGLISRDYSSLGFVLRMALSQDCFGRRHGPISRSWRLAGLICFFSQIQSFCWGCLGSVCGMQDGPDQVCIYVCVPVPIQPNNLPFFFLDNLVWNIYIYILYYMYIYVYRIIVYIYILLFSSVLHNSLYVKFHLFQPQDAWLHEFGDPKADSGLCVHFCFLLTWSSIEVFPFWVLGAMFLPRLFGYTAPYHFSMFFWFQAHQSHEDDPQEATDLVNIFVHMFLVCQLLGQYQLIKKKERKRVVDKQW